MLLQIHLSARSLLTSHNLRVVTVSRSISRLFIPTFLEKERISLEGEEGLTVRLLFSALAGFFKLAHRAASIPLQVTRNKPFSKRHGRLLLEAWSWRNNNETVRVESEKIKWEKCTLSSPHPSSQLSPCREQVDHDDDGGLVDVWCLFDFKTDNFIYEPVLYRCAIINSAINKHIMARIYHCRRLFNARGKSRR